MTRQDAIEELVRAWRVEYLAADPAETEIRLTEILAAINGTEVSPGCWGPTLTVKTAHCDFNLAAGDMLDLGLDGVVMFYGRREGVAIRILRTENCLRVKEAIEFTRRQIARTD